MERGTEEKENLQLRGQSFIRLRIRMGGAGSELILTETNFSIILYPCVEILA